MILIRLFLFHSRTARMSCHWSAPWITTAWCSPWLSIASTLPRGKVGHMAAWMVMINGDLVGYPRPPVDSIGNGMTLDVCIHWNYLAHGYQNDDTSTSDVYCYAT